MFLLVGRSIDRKAVEDQERFHRGVANPSVSVNERMVLDRGKAKRGSFLDQRGIKVVASEGHPRLCDSRFENREITKPKIPPGLLDDHAVQLEDFREREMAPSRQTTVQFPVLFQDPPGGLEEVIGLVRQQV